MNLTAVSSTKFRDRHAVPAGELLSARVEPTS